VVTYPAERPWASCLLSHGASGGVDAPDLQLAARLLPANGVEVLLVEQPWRVAGRRSASPPPRLDEAFTAIVEQVAPRFPYVVGGRSAGARVGCRTGRLLGAVGVLALSFPLHPPGRPERSRLGELLGAGLPVLVVQGTRDAFGSAEDVRSAVGSNAPGRRQAGRRAGPGGRLAAYPRPRSVREHLSGRRGCTVGAADRVRLREARVSAGASTLAGDDRHTC